MAEYYRLGADEALRDLDSTQEGLSSAEIQRRQDEYGKNALPKGERTNWLELIARQFMDLMIFILLIAAAISFIVGETSDVIVILVIVILNAALGIFQEYRAEQSLAALSAMQVPLVRVRREGEVRQVNAEELVPGDIVLLEEGDRVPADGRLIKANNLQIEEAALTGESQPTEKSTDPLPDEKEIALGDRTNMAYMGTSCNYGRGEMVVTNTGLKTELGNIAAMLMQVETGTTPLQKRMSQIAQTLAIAAGVIIFIVFVMGVGIRDIPWPAMFLIAISMAVAAVPEGLPALVTIGLSLGSNRMVKRNALIRRLPAVETLGSVTTICSDKTGTLTKNEMTATHLALPGHSDVNISGIGYTPEGEFFHEDGNPLDPREDKQVGRFVRAMALSTNANLDRSNGKQPNIIGDTTEGAMVVLARKVGWTRDELEEHLPRVAELPFSSERKAMTTIHEVKGGEAEKLFEDGYLAITKGAPDRLLEWASCEIVTEDRQPLTDERREAWAKQIEEMASDGLRVLGVAYRQLDSVPEKVTPEIERDLCLIGLVGIADPARPEAKEAVAIAREAGIRSMMITGDHALTAEAIARNLGIIGEEDRAVTGNQVDKMDDKQLAETLQSVSCFARVSPEHKLRIVRVLKDQGEIVAMTGDGVNDAPALKQADIGVAMGITGTDVSKGAAEMVLTDDNFASIVAAVKEGRTVYDNILKFLKYLLSSNVGEILVMFTALMIGLKLPLLAIQILWINLVTDGLPAIALGFSEPEPGVMKRTPRPVNESIFARGIGRHIVWVGLLIGAVTLIGFVYGFTNHGMEPFSETLGLEHLNSAELAEIVDEEVIPADWDGLTVEERVSLLEDENDVGFGEEEEGSGLLSEAERIPRTIAFTVLAFTQMFEVMAIHAGDRLSFFRSGFKKNTMLMWAVLSTFLLQLLVVYTPFFQETFNTAALSLTEMFVSFLLGAVILFAVEIEKWWTRQQHSDPAEEVQPVAA